MLSLFLPHAAAQQALREPQGNQIAGPTGDRTAWLKFLKAWRAERLTRMGYDPAEYTRADLKWTQSNFISPQVMVEERTLFDPIQNRWTVNRYLDGLEARYGGIDSVLLWPVYPNIGIDNRNQWDLTRDLPGGIAGLRQVVADFHKRHVRVLLPTMGWDNGTADPGKPHWEATAELMAEIGVDGINGDTYAGLPRAFRTALDKTGHAVATEPELAPSDEALAWNTTQWDYWTFAFAPTASRQKWLEPRHLSHICDRWARDKTDNLQHAFFNGIGYVSWENIWGIWNGLTDRDAEALRRLARVERKFASLLVSEHWEPFVPVAQYGVFASVFPGESATLYTFVNRNEFAVEGQQITLESEAGTRWFDVWHGKELQAVRTPAGDTLSFPLEGHGFGSVLRLKPGAQTADLDPFLRESAALTKTPLSAYSREWRPLPQQMTAIEPTAKAATVPSGMIAIPSAEFRFQVSGIEIEGANWEGVDVQYPWEPSARRNHLHTLAIPSFFIDKFPVTNADFKKFLDESHYRPADAHNFLRDWSNGQFPKGWEKKPVTWVGLEDARAYAKWAGKRLPHEWEWQYAAQGNGERVYPWGNEWNDAAVPRPEVGRTLRGPSDVDAHPAGASPFGVMDLTGNIWQWTDEFQDAHTRAAILRGGSYYQAQGSHWYFPQAYKLQEHGKYLLMAPAKDRAATIGFRCVRDGQ